MTEAGAGGYYRDRTRQEAESERHKDVLERVPVVTTHPSAPPVKAKPETVTKNCPSRDLSGTVVDGYPFSLLLPLREDGSITCLVIRVR